MQIVTGGIAVFLAIVLHEIAHGYMAYLLGDDTAKKEKRLSLNPINHIDIMGSIIVPMILILSNVGFAFGWAKPVPVDYRKLKNIKRDIILVSSAGIIANLSLALISSLLIRLCIPFQGTLIGDIAYLFLVQFTLYNVILAVFNALPIPPLDGSKMFLIPIDKPWVYRYLSNEKIGFGIIIMIGIIIPEILKKFNIDFDIFGIYIKHTTKFIINLLP